MHIFLLQNVRNKNVLLLNLKILKYNRLLNYLKRIGQLNTARCLFLRVILDIAVLVDVGGVAAAGHPELARGSVALGRGVLHPDAVRVLHLALEHRYSHRTYHAVCHGHTKQYSL